MYRIKYLKDKVIERKIPSGSKIFVAENDHVSAEDVVAETTQTAGFHIIETALALKTAPQKAIQYILRKEGEKIYKGELLAEKKPFLGKEILHAYATADGTIQSINKSNGQILLKVIRKQSAIPAGVWGKVVGIENNLKIKIQTQVFEMKGKTGRGFLREGSLKIIAQPSDIIRESLISEEHAGKILVGGSLLTHEAMTKAITFGVAGFVCGSINFEDITSIGMDSDIGFSIVVTEGFGTLLMNQEIFDYLKKYDGLYCFIDGINTSLTVPLSKLPDQISAHSESMPIGIGSKVRIVFEDYIGKIGTITELLPDYKFNSDIKAKAFKIKTISKDIIVPENNVEILN